jgi:hypothetical protein
LKCMLQSSFSCCKCRPPALVSMRVGRTNSGHTDAWRRSPPRWCGEKAQAAQCCCGRGEGESSGRSRRDRRRAWRRHMPPPMVWEGGTGRVVLL